MNSLPAPSCPQINATVMASAGTGKTYMLVNRLVRLLLTGARPDAILAITFTRKAAAEMQSRLGERLFSLAAAADDELSERLREIGADVTPDVIERARNLYEALLQGRVSVRTTTFHSFCQEILLRFPLEADVPPGFELLDNSSELLKVARDKLIAEASAEPDGALAMALHTLLEYCSGLSNLDQALNSFISHRGDWWAFTEDAEEPVEFAIARLAEQLGIAGDDSPRESFFNAERMEQLATFASLLDKHPTQGNQSALAAIATARNPEADIDVRFEACCEAFLTKSGTLRSRKPSATQAKKMGDEGQEQFIALHHDIGEALLNALDRLVAIEAWHASSAWYRAGDQLLHHYQQLKQEQRLLDFTDLEWRAYRLLSRSDNALWVQYKLDQRIDHLLVDEFQDTNPTQWRLLLPLLQEMAASNNETLRSVFLVGDAKQSIYRFRRAEPRLFHAAHEWLAEHLGAHAYPLHTSWRSASAIMQCVNKVFDEHGPLAGRLRDFTKHETNLAEQWGQVTVLPLVVSEETAASEVPVADSALRNPLEQPRPEVIEDAYQREGNQIASQIEQLVGQGVVIGHGEKAHTIDYGDIMILVRKRTHTRYYEQALRERGIPYIGAERGTLLQSLEVADMVALLELLFTPYNNLSLATVLRSPLFACSDEDLMRIAQFAEGGWFERLQRLGTESGEDDPLAVAANMLNRWHQLAGQIPIHDLLDRIFNEGNVLARYRAAFPPHLANRAVANLTRFLELALEIDSGRYPSLGHFLARLSSMRDNSDEAPDEAPAQGASERVRILTIHASKGLEAPVIFLADSAQPESRDKGYRTLLEWPPESARPERFMLVGKQSQQASTVKQQLEREQEEQDRESANLLYVALTRARQLLYISGVKPKRGDNTGWYGSLRQALDPLEEKSPEEPCMLESSRPAELPRQAEVQKETTGQPDPRLAKPLTIHASEHEIAPSYQEGGRHATGIAGDEDGRMRGIVIHLLLQALTEAADSEQHDIARRVAAEYNIEADSPLFRQWLNECSQLLANQQLDTIFHPAAGVECLNEVPIIYEQNGCTVHGIVDRLLLSESEAWVVDYKTHRYADSANATELAQNYNQQMRYYREGIARIWPKRKVRSFLLFTTPHLLHELDCDDALSGPAV